MFEEYEYKAVVAYTGYELKRISTCRKELARVGLEDTETVWAFPDPFDQVLIDNVKRCGMLGSRGMMNSLMNHYRTIKRAYSRGMNSILVMEDDVRFLKDVERLREIVDTVPNDADVVLFDWWMKGKATEEDYDRMKERPLIGSHWKEFKDVRSAACYGLSHKGMIAFIDLIEAAAIGMKHGKLRITDQYWPYMATNPKIKCVCAWPCAAVQGYKDGKSLSNMEAIWKRYDRFGIKRTDYGE